MRTTSTRLAALAAIAALGGIASQGVAPSGTTQAGAPNAKQQPAQSGQESPRGAAAAYLGTGYRRRQRAYVGKRYRASVRQHQRHAAKARNRRRG